ncbi:MAG: dipeptidyl aminopeptidase/acylaminoacyl peptidase [Glaciecola sp.]|jgi:dipeptidyl aminopeptidase/acylaminoacyl peptidase
MELTILIRHYQLVLINTVLCATAFACFQSVAATKLSFEDYAQLPNIRFMTISSDGKRLAYTKTFPGSERVMIIDKQSLDAIGSIEVGDTKIQSLYFIEKDNIVIKTSKLSRISNYRGKHHIKNAFVYNIESKKIQPLLTTGDAIHKGQTQLGNIIGISEDKKSIFMPAYIGNDRRFKPDYSLVKVNLASPHIFKPLGIGSENAFDFFLGQDKNPLVRESYNNETNIHTIEVSKADEWQSIYAFESEIREVNLVGVTSDYKYLVVLKHNETTNVFDYQLMSLNNGNIEPTGFAKQDSDIDHVITDINRVVYGFVYSGFIPTYKFFDKDVDARFKSISEMFTDHSVFLKNWSDDFLSLVVYVSGNSAPGDYYLFEKGNSPIYLATSRENIDPVNINPVGQLTVKARDGFEIPTLVTIPKIALANMKNLPAVLLPHGGPASYDTKTFYWKAQALANEGYLVIQPQFRGSSGFGFEHKQAGYGEWGAKMQDDLTDTVLQLSKQGLIDKERVCIVGASYGGYAALAGGAFTPDLYKCVVSISGVSDIPDMMSRAKYENGSNHWVVSYWDKIIAGGNDTDELLKQISPSNFANNFKAPILLLHGEDDHVVRIDQSKLMYKRLKKAGQKVEFVELDGEDHYLSSAETRKQALKEIVTFINKHIGN